MPEADSQTHPLPNRLYAIKNVGTQRYVALKGVQQDIFTVDSSVHDEARWNLERETDGTYTMKNREHDHFATVPGMQADETVRSNPARSKTSWTIRPTPDHAATHHFHIVSKKDTFWSLPTNATTDSNDDPKIPVTVRDPAENYLWLFIKV